MTYTICDTPIVVFIEFSQFDRISAAPRPVYVLLHMPNVTHIEWNYNGYSDRFSDSSQPGPNDVICLTELIAAVGATPGDSACKRPVPKMHTTLLVLVTLACVSFGAVVELRKVSYTVACLQ